MASERVSGRINVLFLAMDEPENLLSHVEVALDGACCDSELRRRVADLVKLELPVNF